MISRVPNTRKPGILIPNMGEGLRMPDTDELVEKLQNSGLVNVYEANLNLLDPEAVWGELGAVSGPGVRWSDIDVIDLSGMRAALTTYDDNGNLVYQAIINSLRDIVNRRAENGHEITVVPEFDQIDYLLSKPNYFEDLQSKGVRMVPTETLRSKDSDVTKKVSNFVSEQLGKGRHSFVIKPGTAALGKGLVILKNQGEGQWKAIIPHEGSNDAGEKVLNSQEAFEEFIVSYLDQSKTHNDVFMLQPYIPNLEISQILINGQKTHVMRLQGPDGIAHGNYKGLDIVLDKVPYELTRFIDYQVRNKMPDFMSDPHYLRTDIMIDLEMADLSDEEKNNFFRMGADRNQGFLRLVHNKTGFDLTDPIIIEYLKKDPKGRETVVNCIFDWMRNRELLSEKNLYVAEYEGAAGTRLWRSENPAALESYASMLLYRAIPATMRPGMEWNRVARHHDDNREVDPPLVANE